MTRRIALPLLLLLLPATLHAAPPAPASQPENKVVYPLSKIIPTYYSDDRDNPPLADLLKSTVTLAVVDHVYTAPTAAHKGQPIALEKIGGDADPAAAFIDASAILAIYGQITGFYNGRGLIGIFTVLDSKELDAHEIDLRKDHTSFTFIIILSHVVQIRTFHYPRNDAADTPPKIDDPADADIAKNSPVQPDSKTVTDLLNKSLLDAYTATLARNRRNVTIALSGADKPGEVILDFLIDAPPPPATATAPAPR